MTNLAANTEHRKLTLGNAQRDYIVSGQFIGPGYFNRALLPAFDDLSSDFGASIYDSMMVDPQVSSCVRVLKSSTVSTGLSISPAKDPGEDGYEQSIEIADYCRFCLEDWMQGSLTEFLDSALDSIAYGNKIAEIVWKVDESKNRLGVYALKPKPRDAVLFVQNIYDDVVGFIGRTEKNLGIGSVQIAVRKDSPHLLPRDKFYWITMLKKDGDPRGNSFLRPAYNPWWSKMQIWPEYMKYLSQFGSPSVLGFTPENAQKVPLLDTNGDVQYDSGGELVTVDANQAMLTALIAWRNGFAAVFPFGSKVEVVQPQADTGSFLAGLNILGVEIAKAILCQTLATEQAQHQARAAAETHQDVLDVVVAYTRATLAESIEERILRKITEFNWGLKYTELTPRVTLGNSANPNLPTLSGAIAQLTSAGYLNPSQFVAVDAMLGLPKRDEDSPDINTGKEENMGEDKKVDE